MYHRVTHGHLSQIFSQPAQLQATWRRRDGRRFICVGTILTPQPTKALVLPVFYLNALQSHATNCQSGPGRSACHHEQMDTARMRTAEHFYPPVLLPLQPITQSAGAKARVGKWRGSWSLWKWSRWKSRRLRRVKVMRASPSQGSRMEPRTVILW